MAQMLLLIVGALVVAAIGFGVAVLITEADPGLAPAEPDERAVPLPGARPLVEADLAAVRFDTAVRGYRMAQVDSAIRRAAYDIGYKEELINVLQAELDALRDGRLDDAETLRETRVAALSAATNAGTDVATNAGADVVTDRGADPGTALVDDDATGGEPTGGFDDGSPPDRSEEADASGRPQRTGHQ